MGFASLYQLPKNNSHCQRCIVRSSGVDEDRFGDAQAGRYQSIVHHDGDILATCLQVLASAYHPDACPQGKVSAMALIIQQYIQCQAGGMLSSHSSLSDDRIEVEYVRSQPDEAVSGKSANPVLRCTIRRDTTEDASKYHFLRDSSDQNTAVGIDDALLSADVLQLLQQYTEALENRFCCPVDIEFGIRSIISQNDKLLGYFHADRLLNRCLGPGRCTSISMSANRARLLSLLDSEIVALMHDLELFFGGYQHFLALAQDTDIDTNIDTDTDFDFDADIGPDPKTAMTFLNRELPTLGEQGQRLQTSVRKLCEKIVPPLATERELPAQPLNFRQWRHDCQSLQDILQKLTQPQKAHMISSVHDLILWLHKRFVDALAPVAAASGQGQITVIAEDKTLVSILRPGLTGLLDAVGLGALKCLLTSSLRILNLANAAFIHAELRQLEPSDAVRILKELFIHFAIACPLYRKQFISVLRSQFNLDQDPELVLFMVEKNPELMDFLLG